jgi:signal transduction histidine kinase
MQYRLNAVEGRAGVKNQFLTDPDLTLPPEMEETLFQIAQEALNNSIKHAAARGVIVSLRAETGWIELRIADDGRGFDVTAVNEAGGLGLTSMSERAAMLNGRVIVESTAGQGTTVIARLPLESHE